MKTAQDAPRRFRVLRGEAHDVGPRTPYGRRGTLFRGEGIEAVWIGKQDEAIDPGWYSQPVVDLIMAIGNCGWSLSALTLFP